MVIVQKENVQYKVSEEELNRYLNDGFVEIKVKKEVKEPTPSEDEFKESAEVEVEEKAEKEVKEPIIKETKKSK